MASGKIDDKIYNSKCSTKNIDRKHIKWKFEGKMKTSEPSRPHENYAVALTYNDDSRDEAWIPGSKIMNADRIMKMWIRSSTGCFPQIYCNKTLWAFAGRPRWVVLCSNMFSISRNIVTEYDLPNTDSCMCINTFSHVERKRCTYSSTCRKHSCYDENS